MDRMTQEEIEQVMVSDLTQGADGSTGRCGVIGEIGCSWPLKGGSLEGKEMGCARTFVHGAIYRQF